MAMVWRGRPITDENTERGASSPAKPAFTMPAHGTVHREAASQTARVPGGSGRREVRWGACRGGAIAPCRVIDRRARPAGRRRDMQRHPSLAQSLPRPSPNPPSVLPRQCDRDDAKAAAAAMTDCAAISCAATASAGAPARQRALGVRSPPLHMR
eukprot:358404-Chlamydomonas_euryale.AAC.10